MGAHADVEANLTRDEAARRAARVFDVDYQLAFDLAAGGEEFLGRSRIGFGVRPGEGPVFLDLVVARLERVVLDGHSLDPACWDGTRLTLPEERLADGGRHLLEAEVVGRFGRSGVGFHRFLDPEDQGEFVYTNLEPYDAHRVFPCFDQPDLKAGFQLEVLAPREWEVIANYPEDSVEVHGERRLWRFPETARISTYLFNLTAGPYVKWEDREAPVPARIFARPSQAAHVPHEELFALTRAGFEFYQRYFEVPYPFPKYDQVFAPEFMTGAMENVGAVLINDTRYLHRHAPSMDDRLERAMVILHEMAHMWFGNLVTMRWWDGLWLNESFATFMSFLALEAATDFDTGWVYFDQKIRAWALWQDELPTTHAIDLDVPETRGCFANFDGITYGKGCCVLKQLAHRLGEETFRRGVSRYLREYAWGNTSNHDFLQALAAEAGVDLEDWAQRWLFTSGVNTVRVELLGEGEGEAPGRLRLTQEPGNGAAVLRPHELRVAVFHEAGGEALGRVDLEVLLDGESVEVELPAAPAPPVLVHPNAGGFGYLKLALDPATLRFLEHGQVRLQDPAVRSSLVDTTRIMVRDAQIHPVDYLRGVLEELEQEAFLPILETMAVFVPTVLHAYLEPAHGTVLGPRLHAAAGRRLRDPDLDAAARSPWFRILVASAVTAEALAELEALLDGEAVLPGPPLDSQQRWSLVARLVLAGRPGAAARVDAEELRDPGDVGRLRALEIRASAPEAAAKAAAWRQVGPETDLSLEQQKVVYAGFHQPGQQALTDPYTERYLQELPALEARGTAMHVAAFAGGLFPRFTEDPGLEAQVATRVAPGTSLSTGAVRALREGLDDTLRWRRIRARARRPRVID